jgi:radical SAM superfamily enzyme YgiQ (UPF0313 family)
MTGKKGYLLYPPISKQERYSSGVGSVGGEQIPLGIYYLAAYLRTRGYVVQVRDAEAEKLTSEDIVRQLDSFRPDFIGISSTTVAFHRALETAVSIKQHFPGTVIILGGPHVTSNADHAMLYPEFDFGVLGEGEITLTELLEAIFSGVKAFSTIPGIAYRDQGRLIRTAPRAYIQNLDDLPMPACDLIPNLALYAPPPSNYKTLPVLNVITSRGCPNLCTFCDKNIFGVKYRERSAQNIFEEIQHLHKAYGMREIAFVDDTFLINHKRIYELFNRVKEAGLFFHWTCMARINNVDYDFLKFLKSHGCWNIAFGIESADEDILKLIKKNIRIDKVREVIRWCAKLKIQTKGFFILGHPTETVETMDRTIRLACELPLDAVVVTINTPIPGSVQYAQAEQYGTLDKRDWSRYNYWNPVFVPFGLTKEILLKKQKEFYLRFYLRPRIAFQFIRSFFGKGGMKRFKTIMKLIEYVIPQTKKG